MGYAGHIQPWFTRVIYSQFPHNGSFSTVTVDNTGDTANISAFSYTVEVFKYAAL